MTLHRPTPDQAHLHSVTAGQLRVVHGVPILDGDAVIGVAKIGSCKADDFSLQDRRIFKAMVVRASAAIVQHLLREQAERTAQQLAESERQLRALADNIPQLAWMADAGGSPYWFNAGWYAYTGLSAEEMRCEWATRVQHPAHIAEVQRHWQEAIAAGQPWEDLMPLRGKDGYYRWFLSRASPIRDATGHIEGWFGTNTDVTARRFLDSATKVLKQHARGPRDAEAAGRGRGARPGGLVHHRSDRERGSRARRAGPRRRQ